MSLNIHYPVPRNARLSQRFRANPQWYQPAFPGHEGVDWAISIGTPICAAADGEVFFINRNPNPKVSPYGIYVRVRHQHGQYETIYAHLSQVTVRENQTVQAGQVIALSGNTGRSTGPHLHFTIKKQGATARKETDYQKDVVDPHPYLDAAATGTPQPTPPAQTTLDVQVTAADGLNLRAAPVIGAVVTTLPCGTVVGSLEAADVTRRKLGQPNQWLWVRTSGGQVGHVAAWHVNVPGAPASTDAPAGEAYRVQVNSPDIPLKLRLGPGTGQPILEDLPHTTILECLESSAATLEKVGKYGDWLHVRTQDGLTGHVAAWYLCLSLDSLTETLDPSVSFGIGAREPEELRPADVDDLERIKGIGPKIAALLTAVGICTFKQIAALTPEQLKTVLAEGGLGGMHIDTWPEQAREMGGAAGD